MSRLAALDMGSNSFHLLVADTRPRGRIKRVKTKKMTIRLGEPVNRTGRLGDAARERARLAVDQLLAIADDHGAERFVAVGTEALRVAEDGPEFLEELSQEHAIEVQLLSGLDEAALSLAGMASAMNLQPGEEVLGLDLGGGSFEVALGGCEGLVDGVSLPLGGARLLDRLSDPPRLCEQAAVHDDAMRLVRSAVEQISASRSAPDTPLRAIGTAGSIRDFGRLGLALTAGQVPAKVRGMVVSRAQFERAYARICSVDAHDRMELDGVSAKRADLLPGAGIALLAVMEAFDLASVTLCDWGLREGVLLDVAGGGRIVDQELVASR